MLNPAKAAYHHLYTDKRWCGPQGIRKQALLRDLYQCQRCDVGLIEGQPKHPRSATVNHKTPHKGDHALFFNLDNCEAVCATCHNSHIQRSERRGVVVGCDVDGRPRDPNHPWHR